jgi:hypothetical protein
MQKEKKLQKKPRQLIRTLKRSHLQKELQLLILLMNLKLFKFQLMDV